MGISPGIVKSAEILLLAAATPNLPRLVSSGEYDNSVTVLVKAATNADLDYDRNLIMTCPEFSVAAP